MINHQYNRREDSHQNNSISMSDWGKSGRVPSLKKKSLLLAWITYLTSTRNRTSAPPLAKSWLRAWREPSQRHIKEKVTPQILDRMDRTHLKIIQHNIRHWPTNKHTQTNVYTKEDPDITLINSHGLIDNATLKLQYYTIH